MEEPADKTDGASGRSSGSRADLAMRNWPAGRYCAHRLNGSAEMPGQSISLDFSKFRDRLPLERPVTFWPCRPRTDRTHASATGAIIDSQSVQTPRLVGPLGFDAGKAITGGTNSNSTPMAVAASSSGIRRTASIASGSAAAVLVPCSSRSRKWSLRPSGMRGEGVQRAIGLAGAEAPANMKMVAAGGLLTIVFAVCRCAQSNRRGRGGTGGRAGIPAARPRCPARSNHPARLLAPSRRSSGR